MLPADFLDCPVCGVAFERPRKPGHPPKFCSETCRAEAKRAQGLATYYANLERNQARSREYQRANRDKAADRPSQQPEYRKRHYAEKRGGGDMRRYVCRACGTPFERPHKPGRPAVYCSKECAAEAVRIKARAWYADHPERVALQPSRERDTRREANAAYYGANREAEVQRSLAYARGPGREAKHKRDARRRALKKGSALPGELFSLDDIFIRDAHVCHICGLTVERSVATMDHVIPITRGGPHTLANVKLAHRSCNTRKSNRLA